MSGVFKLFSGYVFDELAGEDVTLAKLNRMFSAGYADMLKPLPVSMGGTGADNAEDARENLGIADGGEFKNDCDPSTVSRTVVAKLQEAWVSVKDFGAVGDGVADDTVAIQAAIDIIKGPGPCGILYFPGGTYLITAALTISESLIIFGEGPDSTIINNTTLNPALLLLGTGADVDSGTPAADIIIANLQITCALATEAICGLIAERVLIDNVFINGTTDRGIEFGTPSALVKCRDISIVRCRILDTPGIAVALESCDNGLIAENVFEGYGGEAVRLNDCRMCTVKKNRLHTTEAGVNRHIQIEATSSNAVNARTLINNVISENMLIDPPTNKIFIQIAGEGTTEVHCTRILSNAAIKAAGDFDFLVVGQNNPDIIKDTFIDGNYILSDLPNIGIKIRNNAEHTVIGIANCWPNGVNIDDSGIDTVDQATGGGSGGSAANQFSTLLTYQPVPGTILKGLNVASVAPAGASIITITFTTPYLNTNYVVLASCRRNGADHQTCNIAGKTTTTVVIEAERHQALGPHDNTVVPLEFYVGIIGDLTP